MSKLTESIKYYNKRYKINLEDYMDRFNLKPLEYFPSQSNMVFLVADSQDKRRILKIGYKTYMMLEKWKHYYTIENEYNILYELKDFDFLVPAIDIFEPIRFKETTLIGLLKEYKEGETLKNAWRKLNPDIPQRLTKDKTLRPSNVFEWNPKYKIQRIEIADKEKIKVEEFIKKAHNKNIIRLDTHFENIIITPEKELFHIDIGFAVDLNNQISLSISKETENKFKEADWKNFKEIFNFTVHVESDPNEIENYVLSFNSP